MEFVILGRTELRVNGRSVDLGAAKQRGLLGILLYHVGSPVRPEVLMEHLWPGQPSATSRTNLYTLVSRARGVLHDAGLPHALTRIPSTGAYRLDVAPASVDYHRFRRMVAQAKEATRHGRHDTCAELLRDAIGLWRDDPLADLHGDAADRVRDAMNDTLVQAYQCMGSCQLQLGQYDSALTWLEPVVQVHDLDETLAQQWVIALCATGRQAEARRFLTLFRQRFRKEIQAEPAVTMPTSDARSRALPTPGAATTPSGSVGPRQLPNDITDFTGQQELLAQLDLLTDTAGSAPHIVVISGMPGVGKTTLAVHWAHQQQHRFPDGQLYLDASAYGPAPPLDPADALAMLLRGLDVPPERIPPGAEQRRDRVNQLLADRTMLVVLDNVRDSAQVRPLLPVSGTCLTLITSRNRLRGLSIREGVRNITVPPLPGQDCLELLSRSIGQARSGAEPEAMTKLTQLSGGLPLAVRIIGEHVATRPRARIGDLVEELRTRLLNAESEDDDDATLSTVFAWSHNALRQDSAQLFTMLGVYPAETVSVEAAAALNGTAPQLTEQLLDTLAKAHLINHDTVRRYRLHDLLRRYAADRAARDLPEAQTHAATRRMLDWFLLTAANAASCVAPGEPLVPDLPQPLDVQPQAFASDIEATNWCAAERTNLIAVAQWAAEHGWHRHGWQIPGTVNEILDRYGRQDDLRRLLETALRSARTDQHRTGELGTLNNLAATYFAQHDHPRAASTFSDGLKLARELNDRPSQAICLHNLAAVHLAMGDTDTAVTLLHEVLPQWRALGHAVGEASTLHRLGEACRLMGRQDDAANYYRDALTIRERIGSLRGQGATHGELAVLFLEAGQWEPALEHCRQAMAIHDKTKDDVARCDQLTTLAEIQRGMGMRRESIRTARLALSLSEEIADPLRRCHALTSLTHALLHAGHLNAADRVYAEATVLLTDLAVPDATRLRERLEDIRRGRAIRSEVSLRQA
jgi:DNA-binding SARP family transcriptional activator/tetratricopeptide (TPR) repeat protein